MFVKSRLRLVALAAVVLLIASGCKFNPLDSWSPDAVAARIQINALLDQAEVAEAEGRHEDAAAARAEAAEIEASTFLPAPPVGTTTILGDPSLAGGFFDAPWPSDTRLAPDGSIDIDGFPGRSSYPVANLILGRGAATTFGFGTNSAVYFRTDGALDPTTVPAAAESTIQSRSPVLLLDLDDPSAPPVPLLVDHKPSGSPRRPSNLLTLLPYPGHPLRSATRYAALVFNGIHDADGNRLAPSPLIDSLDGAAPPGVSPATWDALRTDRDDALAAVRSRTLWHPSELVAFTAFTTQDTTADTEAVAAAVADLPAPTVLSQQPATSACTTGQVSRSTARLALPVWQQGTRPFVDTGGGIVADSNGRAIQQSTELGSDGQGVILDIAVPCGPAPEAGWPVVIWVGGTGASARAYPINELGPDLQFAAFSIAPLYSGDRLVPGVAAPFDTSEFQFFNWLNPLAARTNSIQQAGDVLYLERLVQGFAFDPDEAAGTVDGRLDTSTVVLGGHSQGATTLPLTLAYTPDRVQGAYLSAGGAGLYHSIVYREDIHTLVDSLVSSPPDEIDIFHPYPHILQTFAEPADNANYASAITTDIVLYGGLRDGCTSIEVSTHLATTLGIPIANPQTRLPLYGPQALVDAGYSSPFEPQVVTTPVSENLPGGRTGVVVQVDSGHFGARTYPAIGRSFVDSIAAGGPVVVDPGPTPPEPPGSQCPRFGPAPTP